MRIASEFPSRGGYGPRSVGSAVTQRPWFEAAGVQPFRVWSQGPSLFFQVHLQLSFCSWELVTVGIDRRRICHQVHRSKASVFSQSDASSLLNGIFLLERDILVQQLGTSVSARKGVSHQGMNSLLPSDYLGLGMEGGARTALQPPAAPPSCYPNPTASFCLFSSEDLPCQRSTEWFPLGHCPIVVRLSWLPRPA